MRMLPVLLAGLAALSLGPGAAQAEQPLHWMPELGLSWSVPQNSGVRDIYSGGLSLDAGLGLPILPGIRAEARGHFYRQSGSPSPGLAGSASSQLTMIPLGAEVAAGTVRGRYRPFVLAGAGMILTREKLTYSLGDQHYSLTGTHRQFTGIAGLGLETGLSSYLLRFTARAYLAGGKRGVLRPDLAGLSGRDAAANSLFTFGLELGRLFPGPDSGRN
jgi:hypothetical protein